MSSRIVYCVRCGVGEERTGNGQRYCKACQKINNARSLEIRTSVLLDRTIDEVNVYLTDLYLNDRGGERLLDHLEMIHLKERTQRDEPWTDDSGSLQPETEIYILEIKRR